MPLVRDIGEAVQRGLPGVAAEEDALPSERVLSGELLGERRREALAGLRAALGDRPDGFLPEEWAVVVAVLSPPSAAPGHHLGGQKARSALTVRARDCFPGFPVHAALRAFREVQARPHVAEVIADFRALEAVDVVEQRAMLREALGAVIALATREGPGESLGDLLAIDANAAAKVSAAVTAAAKTLMDLNGEPQGRWNMRGNGWPLIVTTTGGYRWSAPLQPTDVVLDDEGQPMPRPAS